MDGWEQLRFSEAEIPIAFAGEGNIGVLLGAPSNGITDVDLDSRQALMLAVAFLPPTATFGHASNPDSHHIYVISGDLPAFQKFQDPMKPEDDERAVLLEFRTSGQTVFPPGTHAGTGEQIEWSERKEPATIGGASLLRSVSMLAAAALLARHWPRGKRHDTSLALAGKLLRDGWPEKEAEIFIREVALAAGDEDVPDRVKAVRETLETQKEGKETWGLPKLAELIGERVASKVDEWLPGYAQAKPIPTPEPQATWEELADQLDEIRVGKEVVVTNGKARSTKLPRHKVQERILNFTFEALKQRARFFFDAYPYIFVQDERRVIKFSDEDQAYQFLGRLRLRAQQPDSDLVHSNLELHILGQGNQVPVEQLGCWRGDAIYVNNGRGGMFKITTESIREVENGTDNVFMLSPPEFVRSWPLWNDEVGKEIEARLDGKGLRIGDTKLCRYLNAYFGSGPALQPEQYQQLFVIRFLSFFLGGAHVGIRPLLLALGEQNSGKSTLFEKAIWLIFGNFFHESGESEALPIDLRSFLAAITNSHIKIFDNIDGASVEEMGIADLLCKASTGGMVSIAQLYKTNVERRYSLRCDLMLTSRYNPWPPHRTDLARRTIFLPIRKPTPDEHLTKEQIKEQLEQDRDEMLLEVLVRLKLVLRGLIANRHKHYPPVSEMHSFETLTMRVAEFEGWATEMKEIWRGYYGDFQQKVTEFNPLVYEIRKWLGKQRDGGCPNINRWVRVSQLWKELKDLNPTQREFTWKSDSVLGRAIHRNFTALRVLGIEAKDVNGATRYRFLPNDEQRRMCMEASLPDDFDSTDQIPF